MPVKTSHDNDTPLKGLPDTNDSHFIRWALSNGLITYLLCLFVFIAGIMEWAVEGELFWGLVTIAISIFFAAKQYVSTSSSNGDL